MRWYEIASGLPIVAFSEEEELLTQAEHKPLELADMDERAEEVARQMVARGLLIRYAKDGQVYFRPNSANDIWRDRDG